MTAATFHTTCTQRVNRQKEKVCQAGFHLLGPGPAKIKFMETPSNSDSTPREKEREREKGGCIVMPN